MEEWVKDLKQQNELLTIQYNQQVKLIEELLSKEQNRTSSLFDAVIRKPANNVNASNSNNINKVPIIRRNWPDIKRELENEARMKKIEYEKKMEQAIKEGKLEDPNARVESTG